MVQELDEVLIKDEDRIENNVFKVVHRKSKGGNSLQEQHPQVEEEHWQWTSLKRKKSPVFHSHHNNVRENYELHGSISDAPPKSEFFAHHIEELSEKRTLESVLPKPAVPSTIIMATAQSKAKAIEKTKCTVDDLDKNVETIGSRSHSKCAVEIPRLALTKVKEIALQAKLEAGAYVCQDCQVAVATSRAELGFHRRYPCLLFFCIFLNLMSILSFLFCISVLRTIFPHPAY